MLGPSLILLVNLATTTQSSAFQYASDNLRNNKEIVKEIINNKTDLLQYVSDKLRNDEEIVRIAKGNNFSEIKYASDEVRNAIQNSP